MIARTFALLQRSLRVDSRLLRSHLLRMALLGIAMFFLWITQNDGWSGAPGLKFFGFLQYASLLFITIAGASVFATAITEEKEQRTLGLLRIAGINAGALLLGKWMPRLIAALLLLSVLFPFTLLSITLGGILWHQTVAAYCTVAAHLLLVGSVGLLCSVVCSRTTSACTLAVIMLLAIFIGPFIVVGGAEMVTQLKLWPRATGTAIQDVAKVVLEMSAWWRLGEILTTGFSGSAIGLQVISNSVLALVLFVVSWLVFDPCTRNDLADAPSVSPAARWTPRRLRPRPRRAGEWPETWPIAWKDYHAITRGNRGIAVRVIGYGLLAGVAELVLAAFDGDMPDRRAVAGVLVGTMLWILAIETSLVAARAFRSEVRDQTWPALYLLPQSLPKLAYAKLAGSAAGLIPVLAYLLLGALLALPETVEFFGDMIADNEALLGVSYVLLQVAAYWHFTTLISINWSWALWPVSTSLAAAIVIIGNTMLFACVENLPRFDDDTVMLALTVMSLVLVLTLHLVIGRRLHSLAAD